MALTYPLSFDNFFDMINVTTATFDLPPSTSISGTSGKGEIITQTVGTRLWSGQVTIDTLDLNEGEDVKARIANMTNAGNSFFIYPSQKAAPADDPNGAKLNGYTPKLDTITDNLVMSIKGLPPYYKISIGDYVSFQYGSSPVRYGFHQFAEDVVANSSGEMSVSLTAPMRDGAQEDIALVFVKPYLKAIIDTQNMKYGSIQGVSITGIGFNWQQTLR